MARGRGPRCRPPRPGPALPPPHASLPGGAQLRGGCAAAQTAPSPPPAGEAKAQRSGCSPGPAGLAGARGLRPRQGRAGRRGGHRALPQRLAMALKFKPLRRRVCEGCRPGLPSKLGRETNLLPANTDARPEQSGRRLRAPEQCVRGEQRLQGTPSVPTPAVGAPGSLPAQVPYPRTSVRTAARTRCAFGGSRGARRPQSPRGAPPRPHLLGAHRG